MRMLQRQRERMRHQKRAEAAAKAAKSGPAAALKGCAGRGGRALWQEGAAPTRRGGMVHGRAWEGGVPFQWNLDWLASS
jgi:hypothetical protein